MLALIPWIFGIVVTAILLGAEWYIWDSRYAISTQFPLRPERVGIANDEDVIQVASASGREVVVTLAAQLSNRDTLAIHQVRGETASGLL